MFGSGTSGQVGAAGGRPAPVTRLLVRAVLCAIMTPSATATTYHVRKSGNDGNDGLTAGTAWLTVDQAANTMTAGDEVWVGAGVYDETVTPNNDGAPGTPISYRADTDGAMTGDAGTVEITESTGTTYVLNIGADDYHQFHSFRFTGGNIMIRWTGSVGGLLQDCEVEGAASHGIRVQSASDLTVVGTVVHGNGAQGLYANGASSVTISDSSFYDNGNIGIRGRTAGTTIDVRRTSIFNNTNRGIYLQDADYTVVNCLIYGNTSNGVQLLTGAPTLAMWHCTLDANGTDGLRVQAGTATVRNCIVTGNGDDGIDYDGGTIDHDWDLVWSNGTDYEGTAAAANDLSADPKFVGSGSYKLQSGSPAIDAGTDGSAQTTVDLESVARPDGAGWDVGCHEAVGGGLTINSRSVGTNGATLYSSGDASISSGSDIVTFGGGASLPATVIGLGDELTIGGETFYILSRDSATQVTVQTAATANHTAAAYTIQRAYTTLQSWEDDRGVGNFMADNKREVGVAYNDGPFTGGLDWNYVGAGDHNMVLTVAEGHRHDGTAGSGVMIDAGAFGGTDLIDISSSGQQFEWFEIANLPAGTDAIQTTDGVAGGYLFSHLLIHDDDASAGIRLMADGTVRNCIIYGSMDYPIRVAGTGSTVATIESCTIHGAGINGIHADGGGTPTTVTIRDTISVGSAGNDFDLRGTIAYFGYDMYSTYASFDPAVYQGNNQSPPADLEQLFKSVYPGGEDFHLEDEGHNALGAGIDLSADFTLDIDHEVRSGAWDLGADQCLPSVNYRSVGIDTNPIYATGTASVTAGQSTVTFSGAALPENIGIGDRLTMGGDTFHLLSRDSASSATIQTPSGNTHVNVAYSIDRAYNALQDWENGRQGNLVAEDRREVAVCYDDGDLTSRVTINGSTCDATRYMMITVAPGDRHSGAAGTGLTIDPGGTPGGDVIGVGDEYTVIEWLEITNFTDASGEGIEVYNGGANSVIRNVIVHDYDAAAAGIRFADPASVYNAIVYNGDRGIQLNNGCEGVTIDNCTVYGMSNRGVFENGGAVDVAVRNTIAVGNNIDFNLAGPISFFGNNMYAVTSGFNPAVYQGGNQAPPADLDDLFVTIAPGSENLHLEPGGHAALDAGLDNSSLFSADVDGQYRSGTWDIGADEANPTAGGALVKYRSIGTASGTLYSAGTASVTSGSSVVTFAGGADLPAGVGLGDKVRIGAESFHILSKDSTTQATVQETAASNHVAAAYAIERAYNTLQGWEDDRDGNLVGEGRREVGVCYNDGPFTDPVTISGSTTDATYYMMLTVADGQRHTGTDDTGAIVDACCFATSHDVGQSLILVEDEWTRIEWLQFARIEIGDYSAIEFAASPSGANGSVSNVMAYDCWFSGTMSGVLSAAPNTTVRNSIFRASGHNGVCLLTGGTGVIDNCTIFQCSQGVASGAGTTASIRNTIAVGSSNDDFQLWGSISYFGNNMFTSTTGFDPDAQDGGNQVAPADLDTLFLADALPYDLHLERADHDALNNGLDLSGEFNGDIDDQTRGAVWDLGADEASKSPRLLSWQETEP